jgi:hypothetical protein
MKTQTTMEILNVVNRGEGKKGFWQAAERPAPRALPGCQPL